MLSNTGSTEFVVKYVVYLLPAVTAILFYWITMKVVQQLTCVTLGRPNGQAYYKIIIKLGWLWQEGYLA